MNTWIQASRAVPKGVGWQRKLPAACRILHVALVMTTMYHKSCHRITSVLFCSLCNATRDVRSLADV